MQTPIALRLNLTISALALASVAWAQPPAAAAPQGTILTGAARSAVLGELMLPATSDPTASRAQIEPVSSATIITAAGGTTGKFTFGFQFDDNNYTHVTLSAPATDGRTTLTLGDELPSGTKVTVEFSRLFGAQSVLTGSATTAPLATLQSSGARPATREAALQARRNVVAAARSGALTTSIGILLTGSFDYGRQKFTYRPAETTIDLSPQLRESSGGRFAIGALIRGKTATSATYVGTAYSGGTSWKAKKARTLCTPVTDTSILDCSPVVIGEPDEVHKRTVSAELRTLLAPNVGVTPLAAYDHKADAGKRWTVELPFYLVTDGDQKQPKLNGGVVLGWRQGDGTYLAVFVGPKFSIPGLP